ncbi:MAG: lipopolysaccharide biosynthesis protein [Gemmatimonadales bacterium]
MTDKPWAWSVAQQVGRQAASYAVFIVLARLLQPKDFGLVALATAWIGILGVFSDVGFGAALIQRREITPAHLSSTFFLNAGLGLTAAVLGVAASWPLARVLATPAVQPVVLALSPGFFLNSLSLTHLALAYRDLRFKELAIRDLAAALLGGAVGIVAALRGYGVWSLVAQTLVTSAAGTALLWAMLPWRPAVAEVSGPAIRQLWGYSSKLFSFNLFKYLAQNLDKLLVGVLAGPLVMGLYNFAQKLVVFPVQNFAGAVGNWLFPRLSRVPDRELVKATYFQTCTMTSLAIFPPLAVVAVVAHAGIPLFFGTKWEAAVPIVPLFALVGAAMTLMALAGSLFKALDRPGWLFNWSVFFSLLIGASLAAGNRWGLIGLAAGMAAAHFIGLSVLDMATQRLLAIAPGAWLITTVPALGLALLCGGFSFLVLSLPGAITSGRVGVACTIGAAWYAWGIQRAVRQARRLGPSSAPLGGGEGPVPEPNFLSSSTDG